MRYFDSIERRSKSRKSKVESVSRIVTRVIKLLAIGVFYLRKYISGVLEKRLLVRRYAVYRV